MIEDRKRDLYEEASPTENPGDRRSRSHRPRWWIGAAAILSVSGLTAVLGLAGSNDHPVTVRDGVPPTSPSTSLSARPVEVSPSADGTLLPPDAIVNGRVARPIIVDGGTLTIDPVPESMSPVVTQDHAAEIVQAAQTYTSGVADPAEIGFGLADLDTSLSNGLPSYTSRPAWFGLWGPRTEAGVSCPGATGGITTPPVPTLHVVLLDSQTAGDVLEYRSRGSSPCGGQISGPSVQRAQQNISLPWTAIGETPMSQQQLRRLFPPTANLPKHPVSWIIRYTVPPCASNPETGVFDTAGTNLPVLYVEVLVPISAPPSCASAKTITQSWGPETVPITQVSHARTGIGNPF